VFIKIYYNPPAREPLIKSWWDCYSKISATRRRSQLIVGY